MINYVADISDWKVYEKRDDIKNLERIIHVLDEIEELDDIRYVALEVWNTESFVSSSHPRYMSYYKENEFPVEWYSIIEEECNKRDLELIFIPRDAYSIKKIEVETNNRIFGIHCNDITFTPLIERVSRLSKQLFMWVGNNEIHNIEVAYKKAKENYNGMFTIIENHTQFSTIDDARFARIDDLRHIFKGSFIGYHTTSELTDAITLTNIATAMGCNTICFNYDNISGLNKEEVQHVLQSNNTVHKIVTTSPKIDITNLNWHGRNPMTGRIPVFL